MHWIKVVIDSTTPLPYSPPTPAPLIVGAYGRCDACLTMHACEGGEESRHVLEISDGHAEYRVLHQGAILSILRSCNLRAIHTWKVGSMQLSR